MCVGAAQDMQLEEGLYDWNLSVPFVGHRELANFRRVVMTFRGHK